MIFPLLFAWGCGGHPEIKFKDTVSYTEPPGKGMQQGSNRPFISSNYLIGPSDELEVLYGIDPGLRVGDYLIDTEDTLRIEFYYYPTMNVTVKVRPDGRVTVPQLGEIMVAGLRPGELGKKLEKRYRSQLVRPKITVDLLSFNSKVEELKKAITTQDRGQSRLALVRPDGFISLPFIGDVKVGGLTTPAASEEVENRYRKYIKNLSVTVAVLHDYSNRFYIMGEVARANFYPLQGVTTLSQAIALAGGFSKEANAHQVVVVSRDEKGFPKGTIMDLENVIGKGNIGSDVIINQYDVIFVPKTKLSQAAVSMEKIWTIIPVSFTGAYTASYGMGGIAPTTQ